MHYLITRLPSDGRFAVTAIEIDDSVSPPTFRELTRIGIFKRRSDARATAAMLAGWRGKVFVSK